MGGKHKQAQWLNFRPKLCTVSEIFHSRLKWVLCSRPIRKPTTWRLPSKQTLHWPLFARQFKPRECSLCSKGTWWQVSPSRTTWLQPAAKRSYKLITLNLSLRPRRNLTTVSDVCEAVPRSLLWACKEFHELPEVSFEFSFKLIGKSTLASLARDQSWRVLKSWQTGGDPK